MQHHFTYDELTPLEQCIANFMAAQQTKSEKRKPAKKENAKQKLNA